jgi:hypothetical protein
MPSESTITSATIASIARAAERTQSGIVMNGRRHVDHVRGGRLDEAETAREAEDWRATRG